MPDGDTELPVRAEVLDESRDPVLGSQLAVAREEHHQRGGGERLGERRQVEDRVRRHRRTLGDEAAAPERLVVEHLAAARDQDHGPWEHAAVDRAGDHVGNGREVAGSRAG